MKLLAHLWSVPVLVLAAWLGPVGGSVAGEPDPFNGRLLFEQCKTCHAIKDRGGQTAPRLDDVFGRPSGSVDGYVYSAGMSAQKIIWNEATMLVFLRDPSAYVPGTSMKFGGLAREQDRIDLVAYLRSQM